MTKISSKGEYITETKSKENFILTLLGETCHVTIFCSFIYEGNISTKLFNTFCIKYLWYQKEHYICRKEL